MSPAAGRACWRLAQAAWLVMFIMILSGGAVTSTGSGMAVPDWPTTFGESMWFYDFLDASRSVLIEHGHRLWGTLTGAIVTALVLTLWFARAERPARVLGTLVFAAVVVQGLLGGQRVLRDSQLFAMFHAVMAQGCFVLMSVLAMRLAPERPAPERDAGTEAPVGSISNLALFLTVSAGMQLFFGVMLRHTGYGLVWHLAGAAAVAYAAFLLARALTAAPKSLRDAWGGPVGQVVFLVGLQIVLGGLSWAARLSEGFWALKRAGIPEVVTVLHVGAGALILARAATLTARTWSWMERSGQAELAGGTS